MNESIADLRKKTEEAIVLINRDLLRDLVVHIRLKDLGKTSAKTTKDKWFFTLKGAEYRAKFRATWESYRQSMQLLHRGKK